MPLPATGRSRDDILADLGHRRADDLDTHGGRTWAYVYDAGRGDAEAVAAEALVAAMHENALDPTVFPSVLDLETDLVRIAADHLHGDEHVVGNFTSGGTESCMLAVKTARDHARATRGVGGGTTGVRGEVVLPETAHAAFRKAAHYFDLDLVDVAVDPTTFKADPELIRDAITDRTVLVVASSPSYAHGVIDPIEAIAAVTREAGVLLHVDACIGGWLLPYFARLGDDVPPFDFRVDGVTSISMDLHKYAYTPKGASTLLYRSADLRRHQLFASASWTGYTMINTTFQSTKSAGPLAGAWATMQAFGDDGYLEAARATRDATRQLVDGIRGIEGLDVLGEPEMSLVAIVAEPMADGRSPDLFVLADEMKHRDWYVQPQLSYGSSPANIHLTATATSLDRVDELLADLGQAAVAAAAHEREPEFQQLLDGLGALDPAAFTEDMYAGMLGAVGLGEGTSGAGGLPSDMAEINAVLDALPPALREKLLLAFLNDLYA